MEIIIKNIWRLVEIVGGIILIILGIILLVTPGPGILTIIAGVLLISPYHGKRMIKHIKDYYHKFISLFK